MLLGVEPASGACKPTALPVTLRELPWELSFLYVALYRNLYKNL